MKTGDKNVLMLTGLFPDEIRNEIIINSKFNTQYAADALQWSILKGLSYYYKNLKVVNFPFVGAFPTRYKSPFIKTFDFGQKAFDARNIGYINIIGLKNFDIYLKVKNCLVKWADQTVGEKIILIYAAYLPFLKAAIAVKARTENVKICLVLPDLPQFMNKSNNVFFNIFTQYSSKELEKSFHCVDSYILLTKYMAERLPQGKRWTVVEGIFNNGAENYPCKNALAKNKIILYTGSLAKRYGILGLLEAFKLIRDENYQLMICGDGDAKDDIILAGQTDQRIIFKGSINRDEVLKLQSEASLLVNPRTPEGEFTKFSFPSKTMEYLASGVPTLLYKLPGIPDEYYQYCYSLENGSPVALAEKITEILHSDSKLMVEKGLRAQQFILDEKNPKKQCKKIFDLLEGKN